MVDLAQILEWLIKTVIIILILTAGFAYATLFERRMIARFQVRIGPNRAGPFGVLQPVADGIKLIFKEELIPATADKFIFILAPVLTVIPALVITAVVPWGETLVLFGRPVPLYLADINVGILYIMAITSISIYGITLAGWASNNKYAAMGSLRAMAQMISYELALAFAMIIPVMMAASMSLVDIVNAQRGWPFALLQPLAFVIYFFASLAEVNRAPFDMPEAEQELTAGYLTEYSGMKFALFFMAEYIKLIAVAMIGTALFLGGYHLPFIEVPVFLQPLVFLAKVVIWLFVFIWVRSTWPRIRYDRLMALGWKVLFPISLLNVMVTAVVLLWVGG
jgi:NADH-quinone oxidoreductase subunit H